jgi:CelD/BcsL family acetyltransferase involved in cellulose biosynthesis
MIAASFDEPTGVSRREAVFTASIDRAAPKLKAHLLKPSELDSTLIAQWKQFCDADPLYQSPFYRPQFTLAVAACRADAEIALFEQGGEVIGFLPFHRVRGSIGKPIGGQINDYHGPILSRGTQLDMCSALAAAQLSAYDFNHLPTALGPCTDRFVPAGISPQMDMTDGYDAYVDRQDAGWTKAQREVRRRHRKTEAEIGPLRFVFDDPVDGVFSQLKAMKDRQYARMGLRIRLGAGWTGAVLDCLRHANEPDFAGVTSALYAGDRLIAAHFGLRTADLLHWWFPSYDQALYKLGPGINLVHHCAIEACGRGIRTIDFGKGNEDFKLHFANQHVLLSAGSMVRQGSTAALTRSCASTLVGLASRWPLGRFKAYPGKVAAKFISGVALPG